MGKQTSDELGGWESISQAKKEADLDKAEAKEPPQHPVPPPKVAEPPVKPNQPTIDAGYVAQLAQQNLPNEEALGDFIIWSRDVLPELVKKVIIRASGVDIQVFQNDMQNWLKKVTEAEKALNQKQIPPVEDSQHTKWPPLPGINPDDLCTSTFDANDLALRGRKSVLTKQFYLPMIYPQIKLDPAQTWIFGQKIEYRQEWRHEGFTLGELISSLSLLPNEELTLEVSSWQRTKSEIAEETNAETRDRLERELRRTDEESTINEATASQGWTVSATGSVSYGPASASASASATGNTSERSEHAEKHITDATSKAANEVSFRRAVKLTQTTEAGSEQRTTRRIKNPNACYTVTFNFFQIVKLYDIQLRMDNDALLVMLPGIFPAFYSNGKLVKIPYWTIESFASPAVFLTQYFEADRDLSQELHGWGLRVRMDVARSSASAINHLVEALVVATKYLLRFDPAAHIEQLATIVSDYIRNTTSLRQRTSANYGVDHGRTEQITTPGIYVDSLIGRCTACENYVEASRYVDVMRQQAEVESVERANRLVDTELQRRDGLLKANKFGPFEMKP